MQRYTKFRIFCAFIPAIGAALLIPGIFLTCNEITGLSILGICLIVIGSIIMIIGALFCVLIFNMDHM